MKTKIAVFVSGGGTNLQALIDAAAKGAIADGEIALVLSSRADAYALKRAEAAGIPTAVVSRKESRDSADFEKKILGELSAHGIEMIVLAGFMSILLTKVFAITDRSEAPSPNASKIVQPSISDQYDMPALTAQLGWTFPLVIDS